MRITPEAVLVFYEDGMSLAEVQQLFPGVSIEDIRAIVNYAEMRGISVYAS